LGLVVDIHGGPFVILPVFLDGGLIIPGSWSLAAGLLAEQGKLSHGKKQPVNNSTQKEKRLQQRPIPRRKTMHRIHNTTGLKDEKAHNWERIELQE